MTVCQNYLENHINTNVNQIQILFIFIIAIIIEALRMLDKVRDSCQSVVGKIKQNSIIAISALSISVLGLLAYTYRRKQHHKLYKLYSHLNKNRSRAQASTQSKSISEQQNESSQNMDASKFGIKNFQKIIIHPVKSNSLTGWLIRANIKQRNPKRLIIYYHSQHTRIHDNLGYVKILSQYTVSDVLLIQYSNLPNQRTEKSMKRDAIAIFQRAKEIADAEDKFIVVMGKDLGAMLAIYVCAEEQYRFMYRLKALIIQNIFSSIISNKTKYLTPGLIKSAIQIIYSLILADRWQTKENIMKIRLPTMLLVDKINKHDEDIGLYSLYQGRKVVYQITSNDRLKQQKYRNGSIQQGRRQIMQQNGENSDESWHEDIANYFMEIDIFMNNVN